MGQIFTSYATGAGVTNPSLAAETVVEITPVAPAINVGVNNPATIEGVIYLTAGAGTTAVVIKLRQGTLVTGTQVGTSVTHTLAAAASACIPFQFVDSSSYLNSGAGTYALTVTQTGGTGNGTTNAVAIQASN